MLVRFTVENCLSFRDRVELSMIASGKVRRHPEHFVRAGGENGISVLKLAVIYGANASGKSNLVKAMAMARDLILHPTGAEKPIERMPFKLDPACRDRPTRFEFETKIGERLFAYGFSASSQRIEEEWLFEIGRTSEARIFERTGKRIQWGKLEFSNPDEERFLAFTAKGTLPNRLFLTECRERNVRENVSGATDILNVLDWFQTALVIIRPTWVPENFPGRAYLDKAFKPQLAHYLQCFDTGIEEIDFELVQPETIPIPEAIKNELEARTAPETMFSFMSIDGPYYVWERDGKGQLKAWRLVARHRSQGQDGSNHRVTLDIAEESDGTRRLMHLVPAMIAMMTRDCVYVIDELDRSLHPDILHSYLANFLKYSASRGSQLIVTTHDTTLLQQPFLRRDEVWFVEKGTDQSSRLIALEEYKDADKSKNLQQDYLHGRFGGVPVIRDFSWLGEEHGERT